MSVWVISGSRADYGCLKYIIEKSDYRHIKINIGKHDYFDKLISYSKNKIEVPINNDSITSSFSQIILEFTKLYEQLKPELIVVLGDRWEILACCIPAIFNKIPIAHIGGGETTKGSYDDIFRYSLSKIASYHFVLSTACKEKLNEQGIYNNIHVVGSPRLDFDVKTINKIKYKNKTSLVMVHPETKGSNINYKSLFSALKEIDMDHLIFYPNLDVGYEELCINIGGMSYLENVTLLENMAVEKFLEIMNSVDIMIGNSSAGIQEAASFGLPVVNIGDRQKGRHQQKNIINAVWDKDDIKNAIERGLNTELKKSIKKMDNIYCNNASEKIIDILYATFLQKGCKGIRNGMAKLKEEDVLFIRENIVMYNKAELARMFNVSHGNIRAILSRKTWGNI